MPSPPATPVPAPSAKRRRLEASQSSLRKPFRSPLLSRPSERSSSTIHRTPSPTKLSTCSTPAKLPTSTPTKRPLATANPSHPSSALVEAQKHRTALLSQIRAARTALDTATQALSLENSRKDEDLEVQIRNWRAATRGVAEELCSVAGERVNRLGGGGAWREVVGGRRRGWDDDEEVPKEGKGDDGGYWERGGEEDLGEYGNGEDKKVEEDKEEEWGIGAMLRTLGIPEGMLGWDKEAGCWKDMEKMA